MKNTTLPHLLLFIRKLVPLDEFVSAHKSRYYLHQQSSFFSCGERLLIEDRFPFVTGLFFHHLVVLLDAVVVEGGSLDRVGGG